MSASIRCGNRKVHGDQAATHETVAQVRLCFSRDGGLPSIEEAGGDDEFDADAAYERHLEDAGWREAAAQDDWEAANGVIPFGLAREMAEEPPAPEPVYDGIYTVVRPDATHRTLRLRTQAKDAKFAPGKQVIEYLSGADNEGDYTGFGFVVDGKVQMWKKHQGNVALLRDAEALLADPAGALTAAHCFRCHRTLTVPASIHSGLGPECAKKAGAA